jgi:transcriptional regulator with XRE-family HTH domain
MMQEDIGTKIKRYRKSRRRSQNWLANMIGVSRAALAQWETGKNIIYFMQLKQDTLIKIADALELSELERKDLLDTPLDIIESFIKKIRDTLFRSEKRLPNTWEHLLCEKGAIEEVFNINFSGYNIMREPEKEESYNMFCLFLEYYPNAVKILAYNTPFGEKHKELVNRWLNDEDKNTRLRKLKKDTKKWLLDLKQL